MFRIVDWERNFENNRTKELKKLSWVPFPNKHDGDGYTELLDHPDGAAHYGAWCAIVQVASKCEPRGTLLRDGARPHDAASLARVTKIPRAYLEAAISRLINPVGWIEVVADPEPEQRFMETPQNGATTSQEGASSRACACACATKGSEGNGSEAKGTEQNFKSDGKTMVNQRSMPSSPSPLNAREGRGEAVGKLDLSEVDWSAVVAKAEAVARRIPVLSTADRRDCLKHAVVASLYFNEDWLMDSVEAVVQAKATRKTRQAHFIGVLRCKAKEQFQFDREAMESMLERIEIPDWIWNDQGVLEIRKNAR
jgi:hypothetical protein